MERTHRYANVSTAFCLMSVLAMPQLADAQVASFSKRIVFDPPQITVDTTRSTPPSGTCWDVGPDDQRQWEFTLPPVVGAWNSVSWSIRCNFIVVHFEIASTVHGLIADDNGIRIETIVSSVKITFTYDDSPGDELRLFEQTFSPDVVGREERFFRDDGFINWPGVILREASDHMTFSDVL